LEGRALSRPNDGRHRGRPSKTSNCSARKCTSLRRARPQKQRSPTSNVLAIYFARLIRMPFVKFPRPRTLLFAIGLFFLSGGHVVAQTRSRSVSGPIRINEAALIAPNQDSDIRRSLWFRDGSPGLMYLPPSPVPPIDSYTELTGDPVAFPTPTSSPIVTPSPSNSPTPPDLPSPTPSLPPLPSATPSALPSPSPSIAPSPPQPPPLLSPPPPPPVPPAPYPPAAVLPPVVPEIAMPSGASGPPQWQRCQVEVWNNGSTTPQRPTRRGHRFDEAYVTGTEPAFVRLQFELVAAGQSVVVKPGPGVTVDPPQRELAIEANGECLLSVSLTGSFRESDITF
jgi:hypothetical protein